MPGLISVAASVGFASTQGCFALYTSYTRVWLSHAGLRKRLQTPGLYYEPISPSILKRALWSISNTAAMGLCNGAFIYRWAVHIWIQSSQLKNQGVTNSPTEGFPILVEAGEAGSSQAVVTLLSPIPTTSQIDMGLAWWGRWCKRAWEAALQGDTCTPPQVVVMAKWRRSRNVAPLWEWVAEDGGGVVENTTEARDLVIPYFHITEA